MAEIIVAQRMWQRRDTAANWTAKNPVMAAGEIGVEMGATSTAPQKFKIGNGVSTWTQLAYAGSVDSTGTVWWSSTSAPAAGTGSVGDFHLNTSNGDIYRKTAASTWSLQMNIKGAKGDQGPAGANGADGRNPEYRASATHLQYRLVGDTTWIDLYPLADLKGPPGKDGRDGVDAPTAARSTLTLWSPTGAVVSSAAPTFKMSRAFRCEGSAPFRLRLYTTRAARDADYARPGGTDAPIGSGLQFEFIGIASMLGADLQPVPTLYNNETPPVGELAYILEPTTQVEVVVTLSLMAIEP